MTTLIPMAAPDICPTTFIISAGSVDWGAMRLMEKKEPNRQSNQKNTSDDNPPIPASHSLCLLL
jgi:hypothetical protein